MARTPRQLINEARGRLGSDSLSFDAFSLGASTAADGLNAYNRVIEEFKYNSVDLQYGDVHTTVSILDSTNEVLISALTDPVDVDLIKYLKYTDTTGSNNKLVNIKLISTERAKELEALQPNEGAPRFYYIDQGSVYTVPTVDQNYTLNIGYQKEVTPVTASGVDTEVTFSQKWEKVAIDGIEAYLKDRYRHSDAKKAVADFETKLRNTCRLLNKWNKKKAGIKRIRSTTRKRTRRIF